MIYIYNSMIISDHGYGNESILMKHDSIVLYKRDSKSLMRMTGKGHPKR